MIKMSKQYYEQLKGKTGKLCLLEMSVAHRRCPICHCEVIENNGLYFCSYCVECVNLDCIFTEDEILKV